MDYVQQPKALERKMGIDLFRLLGFVAIVALHCRPNDNDIAAFALLPRFAVPYFFIVAGYFLANRPLDAKATFFRNAPRLLSIYAVCFVLYFGLHIALFPETSFKPYAKYLFAGGSGFHLWFLPALLVSMCFFAYIGARLAAVATISIAVGLYAIGLLFVEFKIKGPYWIFVSGPFFGCVFIAAGYYIRKFDVKISAYAAVAIATTGLALQFVERSLLLSMGIITESAPLDYYLGTLPFGIGIFLFALTMKSDSPTFSFFSKLGRLTLGFYIIHLAYIWIFEKIIPRESVTNSALLATVVTIMSVLTVVTLVRLGVKERYLGG